MTLPVPKPSAACCVQEKWSFHVLETKEVEIDLQACFLDEYLSNRTFKYVHGVKNKFTAKLRLNCLEASEINVFSLLMGPAFEHLMGLTEESLNNAGLAPLSANEFQPFMGTLFLTSSFNLCEDDMFALMDRLTDGASMSLECFREILKSIRGIDAMFGDGSAGEWTVQRNTLRGLHPLEQLMFEQAIYYFFDSVNSSLVYNDEMIGTKAKDVEVRSLSDRKTAGEGCTVDVVCDAHFQFMLGMKLRTVVTNMVQNMEKLLDRLPDPKPITNSITGPIIVMDRGFGKMDHVEIVVKKNLKRITVASTLGSQHQFVTTTSLQQHHEKLKKKKESSALVDLNTYIEPWEVLDDPKVLLGPEVFLAKSKDNPVLQAVAVRDIFDKKKSQKILRFFVYGFPEQAFPLFNVWPEVWKSPLTKLPGIFTTRDNCPYATLAEAHLQRQSMQLTKAQQTADWFTLWCFHCTVTMASKFMSGSHQSQTPSETFQALLKSWFNQSRSTTNMIIGAWNEDAVLVAFSNLPFVKKVFSCGLFKSHRFPWLAASPDAIAVLASNDSRLVCSVIEVKTRTTENTIVEAEGIAAKHNGKNILANIEDDIWNDAVP